MNQEYYQPMRMGVDAVLKAQNMRIGSITWTTDRTVADPSRNVVKLAPTMQDKLQRAKDICKEICTRHPEWSVKRRSINV